MGTVFLAEQIALGNRPVAVKILLRKLLDDPEFLLRFNNEAASTARIHHSNVITVYESGQTGDGSPYIAMEYLEGETLRQTLKRRGALPVTETVDIVEQAARGLNAAHKLGIIHRDIKPDNIFLTRGDEGEVAVKIMDFGVAKLRESATHTLTGMVLGTPAYISFEQASGMRSEELDPRSDVYSLGVVVYEMLTGRIPFHSDTPLGFVRKHMLEEPPPFRVVAPGLPVAPPIERAVMKALKKEREERYQSALEFARALASAAQPAPAPEVSAPLSSRKGVQPPAQGTGGPPPLSASAQAGADIAVQTPPPAPPGRVGAAPGSPAQGSKPRAAAIRPPAVAKLPGLSVVAESPNRLKFVVLGLILLAVIAGGIWYFSRPSPQSPPNATKLSLDTGRSASDAIAIPGTTFTMGRDDASDPEERPAHSVTVPAFHLDKTLVTNAQYADFVKSTSHGAPSGWANGNYPEGQSEWPVTGVSWDDALAYCCSKGLRLPSEAEWEYAARGTDGRLYPWGNDFSSALVNSREDGPGHPEPVGILPRGASPFGVLDMAGNVWEWIADDYKPYPGHQSTFEIPADAKVIRGGSYKCDKDHVTTTTRNDDLASKRSPEIGFRCAKSM